MIFNSIDFLIFFGIVFAIYFFVPQKIKWLFLLAASYFFYGYWKIGYLALLIIPTLLIYFISLKINQTQSHHQRKVFLIFGLISSLGFLIVFKYTDFLGGSLYSLAGLFISGLKYNPLNLLWPIGISFFSFKLVSYLLDVYNEKTKPEKHLGYFALYVAFFPQLLMGPIDRAANFIPELKKKVNFDMERILSGFRLIAWGIFKKMVIADRLAIFVNEMYRDPAQQGINLLFGAYFYAFQIYCDFSGYSDIAIGISRILGFKSMQNFDFPYFSKSMTQFWNKWHISLSTWLRDYLFLPIAYAVMRPIKTATLYKIKAETWGYVVGMFITMFLGGLWHGPSWTLVIWGALHGIYLGVGYTTKKARKKLVKKIKLNKLPALRYGLSVFITFNLVSFAWIFFRAHSLQEAFTYIKYIQLVFNGKGSAYLLFNLVMVIAFILLELLYKNRGKLPVLQRIPAPVKTAGFALFICLIIIFAVDTTNEFIYLQF
ncbi:MAG TPA: MBOAT family O-acyltransferase [Candidatus Kapabacteria bacterium]|nr:MBOAT family O-acyltransferase [Candidatus Kapabacteria bacterium]